MQLNYDWNWNVANTVTHEDLKERKRRRKLAPTAVRGHTRKEGRTRLRPLDGWGAIPRFGSYHVRPLDSHHPAQYWRRRPKSGATVTTGRKGTRKARVAFSSKSVFGGCVDVGKTREGKCNRELEAIYACAAQPYLLQVSPIRASMYVKERQGSLRGRETGQDDVRTRKREESSSGGGESDSGDRVQVRRIVRSPMRRRQQVADTPSFLTRAVGSVIKLVRVAEFEILFISFFVLAVLLFKDLVRSLSPLWLFFSFGVFQIVLLCLHKVLGYQLSSSGYVICEAQQLGVAFYFFWVKKSLFGLNSVKINVDSRSIHKEFRRRQN